MSDSFPWIVCCLTNWLTLFEIRYKLAEKLSERLDEMGKDLTSMIEEVNGASATISKTNRADEPVSYFSPYCFLVPHADPTTDLSNRPHPQLASVPAAGYRPGHLRAAGQGCCRSKGWTVHLFAPGLRLCQPYGRWQCCR